MNCNHMMSVIQRLLGIENMNLTKAKVFASVTLILLGMGFAGYASVDLISGASTSTNNIGIVVLCLVGFLVFYQKLSVNE